MFQKLKDRLEVSNLYVRLLEERLMRTIMGSKRS